MAGVVPKDAHFVGSVNEMAKRLGVDATIRDAIQTMFKASSRPEAALRLGAIRVYIHHGLHTTGGFFKAYRDGRPVGIFLNARWFSKPEALRQTFLHEVAHAAVVLAGHPLDHGPKWRGFMEALGLEPTRCHREHELVGAFWVAYCPACGLTLDHVRRVRRPRSNYGHATCPVTPDTTVTWLWAGPTGKSTEGRKKS